MKTKAAPSSSYTTLLTPGVDGSQLFGREALVIVSALRSPKEVLSPQLSAHRVRTSTFHRNYVHSGGWQIFSEKKSEVHDLYRLMHLDESAMVAGAASATVQQLPLKLLHQRQRGQK